MKFLEGWEGGGAFSHKHLKATFNENSTLNNLIANDDQT